MPRLPKDEGSKESAEDMDLRHRDELEEYDFGTPNDNQPLRSEIVQRQEEERSDLQRQAAEESRRLHAENLRTREKGRGGGRDR